MDTTVSMPTVVNKRDQFYWGNLILNVNNYDFKRVFTYIILSFGLYKISVYFDTSMLINTVYLFVFIVAVIILEKSKKEVISEPELFD